MSYVYYPTDVLLDKIVKYICKIELPQNAILPDTNSKTLYEILEYINRYICDINIDSQYNCILSSSPTNLKQLLDVFFDYLCNIEIKYDCLNIESPASLHTVIDGIFEYICEIPLQYDCLNLGSIVDLYRFLTGFNQYVCYIPFTNNCVFGYANRINNIE